MRSQPSAIHPLDGSAIKWLRFTMRQLAQKELQQDSALGIRVRDGLKQFAHDDFNAEFLAEFTQERLLEGFAGLEFTAGEFPQAAEMRVGMALGDEQLTGAEHEARADFDDFRTHQRPMLL